MARPTPSEDNVQKVTTLFLLTAVLILATARSVILHQHRLNELHFPRRALPAATLFLADTPVLASHARPISPVQRVRFVMARLAGYSGAGRGFARVAHVVVSLVGILGMFSAIVGALLGPWLADTADDGLDDERFSYWVCEEEEEDERVCGFVREDKYGNLRLFEVP